MFIFPQNWNEFLSLVADTAGTLSFAYVIYSLFKRSLRSGIIGKIANFMFSLYLNFRMKDGGIFFNTQLVRSIRKRLYSKDEETIETALYEIRNLSNENLEKVKGYLREVICDELTPGSELYKKALRELGHQYNIY